LNIDALHAVLVTSVDGNVVKATLPEAMLWVWRGYQGG